MPAKKKMNAYFKLMTEARKNQAKSFVYKGNTYSQMKTKSGMTVYKKK